MGNVNTGQAKPAGKAIRIAVIGAGPGGLCAGIKLRAAGFENFTIFEKAGGVGGTWYNTRYPGLTCDVKSYIYSFTFEPNPHWTNHYAGQPEILAYMDRVATKYGLRPHLQLNTEIVRAVWNEDRAQWHLTTGDGREHIADAVIAAQGMFNELNWPDIPGLNDFGGTLFHAGRWQEDHDLSGARVAVIGSAASAVQFVPKIAPKVKRLTVYQRSAPWVAPKEDTPVDAAEQERLAHDPAAMAQLRQQIYDQLEHVITFADRDLLAEMTKAGLQNLEAINDPALRAKMTPHVPFGCLRPLISNEYYPAFNRANVELVTDGIAHIEKDGVVSRDGTLRKADTIICATGYQVRKYLSAIAVEGRGGQTLNDAWAKGAEAYLGIMVSGFPNLFMLYGPNTNNGSILFMLECQADFVADRLTRMERDNLARIEIRRDVMDRYNVALQADLDHVEVWQASCSNYYRTPAGRIVTQWPHTMREYHARCAEQDESRFAVEARAASVG
jgi:cation diffusion facilitator CzcD-associated flavoprotein CzcO